MAFAHNAMLRGLNAIYLQAPHIPKADVSDFLFFVETWSHWIMHHHTLEEESMFPGFEATPGVKPGQLSHNVEQHHLFAAGLETLYKYATSTTPDQYDGKRVRDVVESFAKEIREHLADEIETLWGLDCCDVGQGENLLKVFRAAESDAGKQDKTAVPPMVLGLCDRTFEGGNNWPSLPLGAAYIVHYIFARKHRGAWRFLPCDTFRNPRPLAFLGDKK
jgi:hemerythrin-like domain-containing protein